MKVNILTKNPGKQLAAEEAFKKYGIAVNFIEKDFPEIQADSSLEIAAFTAKMAAKELNMPVVREDHSLFLDALGIPGPYTSFIEKKLDCKKLIKILENSSSWNGHFEVATVYAFPNGKTKSWIFRVPITISKKPKGELSGGWNKVIMLKGEKRTIAEYPEKERINVWNKNFEKIAKELKSGKL